MLFHRPLPAPFAKYDRDRMTRWLADFKKFTREAKQYTYDVSTQSMYNHYRIGMNMRLGTLRTLMDQAQCHHVMRNHQNGGMTCIKCKASWGGHVLNDPRYMHLRDED